MGIERQTYRKQQYDQLPAVVHDHVYVAGDHDARRDLYMPVEHVEDGAELSILDDEEGAVMVGAPQCEVVAHARQQVSCPICKCGDGLVLGGWLWVAPRGMAYQIASGVLIVRVINPD